jgi:pimeloyl-ACP methyl ester carboxylesterase
MFGLRMMGCAASLTWLGAFAGAPAADSTRFLVPSSAHAGHERPGRSSCGADSRGRLLSVVPLQRYSAQGLREYWDSWLHGLAALGYVNDTVDPGIRSGAATFAITYCTVDFDSTPIVGSGMLAIPSTPRRAPSVMYSHGTAVTRVDTPSNPDVDATFDGPSGMVIFAGHGYIYLAPDLTGFGASTAPRHRYMHAETVAKSSLDMLRAVQGFALYRRRSDGRLFNTGYSQGGHSALAFAARAEAAGVEIVATSVGGAVTNPDAWFSWGIEQVDNRYLQVYPSYLLISYDDVYGDIFHDLAAAFAHPFDVELDRIFDMNHPYEEVIAGMPGSTAELLTPAFFEQIHDPRSSIRTHLRENAVDQVCLDSPIRMFHMIDDDEVPYELSVDALARLSRCNDVELIDWIGSDHLNTWHETLPEVRDWFDSF